MTPAIKRTFVGAIKLSGLFGGWPTNAQAAFVPTRVFGADEDGPIEALLVSSPRFVTTGNGYVVVGDAAGGKVKVYDRDGAFRYVIDARGEAPGEIRRVSDAAVLGNDLWLVAPSKPSITGASLQAPKKWRIPVMDRARHAC